LFVWVDKEEEEEEEEERRMQGLVFLLWVLLGTTIIIVTLPTGSRAMPVCGLNGHAYEYFSGGVLLITDRYGITIVVVNLDVEPDSYPRRSF